MASVGTLCTHKFTDIHIKRVSCIFCKNSGYSFLDGGIYIDGILSSEVLCI